jgi:Ca2+-dependent lipid-binding protein
MGLPAEKINKYTKDLRKSRRQSRADNYIKENNENSEKVGGQVQNSGLADENIQKLLNKKGDSQADNYGLGKMTGGNRKDYLRKAMDGQKINSPSNILKQASNKNKSEEKKESKNPRQVSRSLNKKRHYQKQVREDLKKKMKAKAKKKIEKKFKKQVVRKVLMFLAEGFIAFIAVAWPWILLALVIVGGVFFIYYEGCTNGFATRWVFERMTGVTCIVEESGSHDSSNAQPPSAQGPTQEGTTVSE